MKFQIRRFDILEGVIFEKRIYIYFHRMISASVTMVRFANPRHYVGIYMTVSIWSSVWQCIDESITYSQNVQSVDGGIELDLGYPLVRIDQTNSATLVGSGLFGGSQRVQRCPRFHDAKRNNPFNTGNESGVGCTLICD